METILSVLALVGCAAYLIIGWSLGSLSWEIWHNQKGSVLVWFLFPLSSLYGTVGREDQPMPLNWFVNRNRELPFLQPNDSETNRARNEYCMWLAVFWPVKVAYNLLLLSLWVGPNIVLRHCGRGHG